VLVTRSRRHSAPALRLVVLPRLMSFCQVAWAWSVSKVLGKSPVLLEWSVPRASRSVLRQMSVTRSWLSIARLPSCWWLTGSLLGPLSKWVLALL